MKKIIYWIKKNYLFLLPLIPILIYVISIWNSNYDTFGDTSVPLNPLNNIEKSLYLWELINHGANMWRHMYLLWQLPFYVLSHLSIPPYAAIKIYMVSIMVIGFIFSYLFYMAFFKNTKFNDKKLGLLFSCLFVLSAGSVDILPTTIFLSALPLCSYLLIKYLDTSKIRYLVFFSIAINYSYLAHLPQAKYLFVLLGELFFVLILYMQVRNINVRNLITKLIVFSVFTILLNAFALVPFFYETFRHGGTYSYYTQNVTILNGDAELNTANLQFVTRFFTSSLMSGEGSLARFLSSPLFSFWTFLLWIISFMSIFFVKSKKEKYIVYLCILGFVSFMFLAKGPNPPFGEIYKFLLFNVPIFKVFRTTSMSVIGATIFFAILVTMSMYYLRKKLQKIILIILLIHLVIFAPVYFGVRLVTFEEKGQIKKGFSIPNEYYQMGNTLDAIKEDVKILSLPLDDSYTYKDWPYIGQSIMGWITKKPYIHGQVAGYPGFTDNLILQRMDTKEACFWTAINNIGYILNEKDSRIVDYSLSKFTFSGTKVVEDTYFKLEKVKPDCILPHIYVGHNVFLYDGDKNSIPSVSSFIPNKEDIVVGLDSSINQGPDAQAITQRIIEARPDEISKLSDNPITQKLFSDLSYLDSLDFWTYSFSIPEDGRYEMIVEDNGVIHRESKNFKKGKNIVKIPVSRSNSLINQDQLSLFVNDRTATSFLQPINDLQGDSIYLLSLKYKTDKASKIIVTVEQRERHFNGRLPFYDYNATLFSQEVNQQNPGAYQYQAIIRTYVNALSGTASIQKLLGDSTIESFNIEKVSPPKVFFTILKDEKKIPPNVVFTKINPTKYNVDVKNAKSPYYLVFSESFSTNWKVYIQQCETSCNIFQEWMKDPIAEKQHVFVNGFSNGWNITPKDSNGKTNYTIIIEYWPQRLFYIGAIISGVMIAICMALEIIHKMRKNHQ